jgi:predicted MFS family arabinose efflux permease
MIGALVLSIISDRFPFERRGKAMGFLMAAFSAAAALGVPFGLLLADLYSWQAPFIFLGLAGMGIWFFLQWAIPDMRGHMLTGLAPFSVKKVVRDIATDNNQLRGLLLGFILIFGHYVIIPFITPYMVRNVGFTQTEVTYIYLLGGVLTVFSSPIVGRLTDRLGALRVFTITLFLSFIPVIVMTNLPPVPIFLALAVTSAFFVLGSGRMIAPQAMITAAVGPANRGSFMSTKSALQQLAIALAAFLSGQIVVEGEGGRLLHYEWVGYLSVVVCLVALYLARRLKVAAGN